MTILVTARAALPPPGPLPGWDGVQQALAPAHLGRGLGRVSARALLVALLIAAAVTGFIVNDPAASARAVAQAGPDLTRLLRGMAAIKALVAATATAAIVWRLGVPATPLRFATYALAAAAMWAGPGLIWGMAHVGAGALLLHGGLAATIILLWRDPAVAARLSAMAPARRRTAR